jgi:hypothetical protein
VAQKLLGHADPRTTSLYYSAFEVSDADAAADVLSRSVSTLRAPKKFAQGKIRAQAVTPSESALD